MPVSVVIGLQWGDEGKGKIVDELSDTTDIVVRCQGGANAGHTVVIGDKVFALHLLPSGIVRKNVTCVVGNGVVIDPLCLVDEIERLATSDISVDGRLIISSRAQMVLPYHKVIDGLREQNRGKDNIGTTKRGIGPTYADKAARTGIRWHQAVDRAEFGKILKNRIEAANSLIKYLGGEELDPEKVINEVSPAIDRLRPFIADSVAVLQTALKDDRNILLEGAQGGMLDIDFGTYPFVTSSNTTIGGCVTGCGIPPTRINDIHGILKVFTTRVGAGPFPTELDGAIAEALRGTGENQWDEFGTTTGRPRRVGWLDLVVGRYSILINGVTHLHLTKLDILSQFDELKICSSYKLDGKETVDFPASLDELARCEPVYETIPGWKCDIRDCSTIDDLPENARTYVQRISEVLATPIATANYGPGRGECIRNF